MGLVLGACSDSTGPDDDLYLRFLADGALVEFTDRFSLIATFDNGGQPYLVITGFDATSSAGLQVYHTQQITLGTYSGYELQAGGLAGVVIHYDPPGGVLHQTDTSGPVDATVTITEITGSRVRGTFSATISASGHADLAITEGAFSVARTN
jgi:hypothetical protein